MSEPKKEPKLLIFHQKSQKKANRTSMQLKFNRKVKRDYTLVLDLSSIINDLPLIASKMAMSQGNKGTVKVGIAICHPEDQYNKKAGVAQAKNAMKDEEVIITNLELNPEEGASMAINLSSVNVNIYLHKINYLKGTYKGTIWPDTTFDF